MKVNIIGAGVAGLSLAWELNQQGVEVHIFERAKAIGEQACSWFAGGMLAPWCEAENAEPVVLAYGTKALGWWQKVLDGEGITAKGTLVFSQPRDRKELQRFARRTSAYQLIDKHAIAELEPDLASQFEQALYFKDEAHLDPRQALLQLASKLQQNGVTIHFNQACTPEEFLPEKVVDCRGYNATDSLSGLRPVKGEMLLVKTKEITLSRPVRLLHPRIPLYVVPRDEQHFMIGATMVESGQSDKFSVRSMLELLGSAYALHPSFAEAEIVEMGVDLRPAFIDNLPRVERDKNLWSINGLYRHGYLLAPYMAQLAAKSIIEDTSEIEKLADFCVKE
mgnify:CR=1 FL=1